MEIKDILKKIYKSGYVQYEDLKDEFKGIEVYNCIYEWMYSSLIVVNNVEY